MRIFALIPVLAALATAVAGVALPRADDCGYEMGCEVAQSISQRDFSGERAARTVPGLTNAELLRRGLPLKDPIMRRGTPVRRSNPSDTPPQPNTKHRGYIRVKRLSDNSVLGYVSRIPLSTGQFGYRDITQALVVNFEMDSTGSGTKLDLNTENSDVPGFALLGMVQGRDDTNSDLSAGSFHYTYLATTNKTPPGSVPVGVGNSYTIGLPRTSESAVWTYNSATGSLTPYWINSDGSTPTIEYFSQNTGIYMGGDSAAFLAKYPAPIIPLAFDLVPIVPT